MIVDAYQSAEAPRHPWCDAFCQYLDRAIRLDALRESVVDAPDEPGALVLLPSFAWLEPRISVGRKTRNPDGTDFTLPVRLTYDESPVRTLKPNGSISVPYRVHGMGYDMVAVLTVSTHIGGSAEPVIKCDSAGVPRSMIVPTSTNVRREASRAFRDAQHARWTLATEFLRPYLEHEADRALSALRSSSFHSGPVPEAVRDAVIDAIAFGISTKKQSDPPLLRLIDRCCDPEAFLRADPNKVVSRSLRRDTMNAARSVTGDTRLGMKLRGLAEELGPNVTPRALAREANRRGLSSAKITEEKARIALDYVMPVNVALPRRITGDPE